MIVVHVHVHVKNDSIEAFKKASTQNASASIMEPGIARFDVVQDMADPARFVLVEAYKSPEDPGRHKETPHYKKWRDTVEPMMAEPRKGVKFQPIFPHEKDW
ncbi:MAG: antibiotic biosynthesis monooxygenase [Spirochaetaceae bacterium]|nr:MAG: antibiotic biosynthesis monooxygenase [Spirochaetaceae bacterium]